MGSETESEMDAFKNLRAARVAEAVSSLWSHFKTQTQEEEPPNNRLWFLLLCFMFVRACLELPQLLILNETRGRSPTNTSLPPTCTQRPACATLYVFTIHTSSQEWRARVSSSARRRWRNIESQTEKRIHAFIFSCLHYCNVLNAGWKEKLMGCNSSNTEKFTAALAFLYWLPVALSLKDSSSCGTFIPVWRRLCGVCSTWSSHCCRTVKCCPY